MPIEYVTGDATSPTGVGPKIIVHVCNDVGGWGRGFVVAISRRWPAPESQYRAWHRGDTPQPFALGQVQFVQTTPEIWVANLIGQRDIRANAGVPPIRYDALRAGLRIVAASPADWALQSTCPASVAVWLVANGRKYPKSSNRNWSRKALA